MEHDPLDALRQQPLPPATLENRVVQALKSAGAIGEPARSGRAWLSVAALLLFASGMVMGRLSVTDPPPQNAGAPVYMLLLGGETAPTADGSSRAAEYGDWARSLAARGITVRGAELREGGTVVGRTDEAPPDALLSAGGYFIVDVSTEADAVALAETCPHVKYGGSIVVRRLN